MNNANKELLSVFAKLLDEVRDEFKRNLNDNTRYIEESFDRVNASIDRITKKLCHVDRGLNRIEGSFYQINRSSSSHYSKWQDGYKSHSVSGSRADMW